MTRPGPSADDSSTDRQLTDDLRWRYLDLLRHTLITAPDDSGSADGPAADPGPKAAPAWIRERALQLLGYRSRLPWTRSQNQRGETQADPAPFELLQDCLVRVLGEQVLGDLMVAGPDHGVPGRPAVERPGAGVWWRAVLASYGVTDRLVWVADSAGTDRAEADDDHRPDSPGPQAETFARYDLLDEQVRFLSGWLADSLPSAPVDRLAAIALELERYDSTLVALESLYPLLSIGGFLIVDGYTSNGDCRAATDDFRASNRITEDLQYDVTAGWWRRTR